MTRFLIGIAGIVVILAIALLLSTDRRAIRLRVVGAAFALQAGIATLVLAPFGAFALNLSAITAAICMDPEAHPDREKRYTAAVVCGALYAAIGLVGALVTGLLIAFPRELVMAIAGIALLGSIGGGLHTALQDERHREAALITFLVTLSGVVIAGIGSAFWGVIAGAIALFVQQYRTHSKAP